MPRVIDFKKKAEELRAILEKYNGIPTFKEDRVAYANVCYYIKNHGDKPEIKALIDEYNLAAPIDRKSEDYFENRLEEIKSILERCQRIPNNKKDYQAVYNFFNNYKDNPEVQRLMYIYADPDCFVSVTGKPMISKSYQSYWSLCDKYTAAEYIKFVYDKYKVLPARATVPVVKLRSVYFYRKRVKEEEKYEVLKYFKSLSIIRELSDLGLSDEDLFQLVTIRYK